mmetsp:Transcript_81279/g.263247  ORF Transcript_81279/g.263247 Transcript_81279/m.263247 type:complete len:205 (-) Transcript_81279:1807-2421(-)
MSAATAGGARAAMPASRSAGLQAAGRRGHPGPTRPRVQLLPSSVAPNPACLPNFALSCASCNCVLLAPRPTRPQPCAVKAAYPWRARNCGVPRRHRGHKRSAGVLRPPRCEGAASARPLWPQSRPGSGPHPPASRWKAPRPREAPEGHPNSRRVRCYPHALAATPLSARQAPPSTGQCAMPPGPCGSWGRARGAPQRAAPLGRC